MNAFSIADVEQYCEMMYGKPMSEFYIVPYGYPISFTPLAASGQDNKVINLSANGDFIALGLSHFCRPDGALLTITSKLAPNVQALFTDASSGDPFTQNAAQLEEWSSNGLGLVNFAFPRFLQGRGAINVQVKNLSATAIPSLDLFLHGVLVRAWSDAPRSAQL